MTTASNARKGVPPQIAAQHPVVAGLDPDWPQLLGYNRVAPKAEARMIARIGADPLIVAGTFGKGRAIAVTPDCGPHWAPPPFVDWPGYDRLWAQRADWVGNIPASRS